MNVQIIQQRLNSYNCRTEIEEQQAIREITQKVVLAALGRGDFFKHALFQGGTCLRIFHSLNRFSEDMDFALIKPEGAFVLAPLLDQGPDDFICNCGPACIPYLKPRSMVNAPDYKPTIAPQ